MQDKLDTRVQIVGWGTVALSVYGVIASGAAILVFLGFGGMAAMAGDGIGGFFSGLGFGIFGALIALVGVFLALCQGLVGLMVLNGKKLGWGIGLAFGVLGVIAYTLTGAWLWAAWSGFVVWALVTSSRQFTK
jgi:hypothetical protein